MHYRELLLQAASPAGDGELPPGELAAIYTEMNLDVRFVHSGGGFWGLANWAPRTMPRKATPTRRPQPVKLRPVLEPEEDLLYDAGRQDEDEDDDDEEVDIDELEEPAESDPEIDEGDEDWEPEAR